MATVKEIEVSVISSLSFIHQWFAMVQILYDMAWSYNGLAGQKEQINDMVL